jgi:hypothetical protein
MGIEKVHTGVERTEGECQACAEKRDAEVCPSSPTRLNSLINGIPELRATCGQGRPPGVARPSPVPSSSATAGDPAPQPGQQPGQQPGPEPGSPRPRNGRHGKLRQTGKPDSARKVPVSPALSLLHPQALSVLNPQALSLLHPLARSLPHPQALSLLNPQALSLLHPLARSLPHP